MTESTEPQPADAEAALRTLADTHRRRHRWVALFSSVTVGLGWLGWGLRGLRQADAPDCRWTLQHVRWQAQDRAWRAVGGA